MFDSSVVARRIPTLGAVVKEWLELEAPTLRPTTVTGYVYSMRLFGRAGIETLADVTREKVGAFLERRRAQGLTPQTCNRNLAALLSVMGWLVPRGQFTQEELERLRSLWARVAQPEPPLFLTHEEYDRLQAAADATHPLLGLAVLIGVHTGLRITELAWLKHEDFLLDEREPYLRVGHDKARPTKTGTRRTVPLAAAFVAELRRRREGLLAEGAVFPGSTCSDVYIRRKKLQDGLAIARVAARVTDRTTFTILRHTFASWQLRAGIPIERIAKWLGNSIVTCLKHYAGLFGGDKLVERGFERRGLASPSAPPVADPGAHSLTTRVLRPSSIEPPRCEPEGRRAMTIGDRLALVRERFGELSPRTTRREVFVREIRVALDRYTAWEYDDLEPKEEELRTALARCESVLDPAATTAWVLRAEGSPCALLGESFARKRGLAAPLRAEDDTPPSGAPVRK